MTLPETVFTRLASCVNGENGCRSLARPAAHIDQRSSAHTSPPLPPVQSPLRSTISGTRARSSRLSSSDSWWPPWRRTQTLTLTRQPWKPLLTRWVGCGVLRNVGGDECGIEARCFEGFSEEHSVKPDPICIATTPSHPPFSWQTLAEVDLAGDGRINPEEWLALVRRNPDVISFMNLPVLQELTSRFPA